MSTYVTVVNAGPFVELRSTRNGYDLGLYARRSLAPMLERDAEELFDLTAKGLAFYGEQFDMPFPQQRYDQVFVPEHGWRDGELRLRHLERQLHLPRPAVVRRA